MIATDVGAGVDAVPATQSGRTHSSTGSGRQLAHPGPRLSAIAAEAAVACDGCGRRFLQGTFDALLRVCDSCGHPSRVPASARLQQLADPGSASRASWNSPHGDVPQVYDRGAYRERLARARQSSGVDEALSVARARLTGRPIVVACMDFGFLGGSLGNTAGEAFAGACELACEEQRPLVAVCTSGGARMQEGVAALAQMARCTAGVALLANAGLPYIAVLVDPCFGGVTASFATQADVILAEPGARIGFAGSRVIQQVTHDALPGGFQTAEFLLDHGMLDAVVERRHLRDVIGTLLSALAPRSSGLSALRSATGAAWRTRATGR